MGKHHGRATATCQLLSDIGPKVTGKQQQKQTTLHQLKSHSAFIPSSPFFQQTFFVKGKSGHGWCEHKVCTTKELLGRLGTTPNRSMIISWRLWARSYVLSTWPRQNVLETSSRYTSIQIASTVKCSWYPFIQILNRHTSRSAQHDLFVYTLRNVWGHFKVHSPCW